MQIDFEGFLDSFNSDQPLSIAGIAIGSPMDSISSRDIVSSDPEVTYSRSYQEGKKFRILDDGTKEELSSAQRYKEVEQYGGWLRTTDISWYIKNQTVQRYVVIGDQLASFNLYNEDQINRVFGSPDCKFQI